MAGDTSPRAKANRWFAALLLVVLVLMPTAWTIWCFASGWPLLTSLYCNYWAIATGGSTLGILWYVLIVVLTLVVALALVVVLASIWFGVLEPQLMRTNRTDNVRRDHNGEDKSGHTLNES
ncbi:MAG: hypothetical protein R3C10_24230 [Pirellulales bacterium]